MALQLAPTPTLDSTRGGASYIRKHRLFLLLVAGLGGLLYGIDVGIIGGALPYLEATSGLTAAELSVIVAAVLLGSVFSTLFAGALADWMGRKPLMVLSGAAFVASIPLIALAQGYGPLFFGRLLQGISGGLIGVVVPLYLAECLAASERGKGTGVFQWLLTLGIVIAALVGMYYSYWVAAIAAHGNAASLFAFKDRAWRGIFWVSLPPGVLFMLGSLLIAESPRWLHRKGRKYQALVALLRTRTPQEARRELAEMEALEQTRAAQAAARLAPCDSLLRRKYVLPFLLACSILFCNTATGVNSIIGYNTGILLESGLSDLAAHWGYVAFTTVNFLLTLVGMTLVDRKGRKFLLVVGTSGIIVSLCAVGVLFLRSERRGVNVAGALQQMTGPAQELNLRFDPQTATRLLATQVAAGTSIDSSRASLVVVYSYGDFAAATSFVRSDDSAALPIAIRRANCLPANRVEAFFKNPFGSLANSRTAPLRVRRAMIAPIPSARHGWMVALGLYAFIGFFALGPGVCVWLALSELMPNRIRSHGMSIALVINQLVSTTLAGVFLPFVGRFGYAEMFFIFSGFTVVYLLVALILLPETEGKTLEEIEAHFA